MKVISTIDTRAPGTVRVHCEDDDNIAFIKNISYHDYLAILQNSTVSDGERVKRIGTLPFGWYDGGYEESTGTYEAILHLPAAERPFIYYGKSYVVPFPGLVFYLKAQKGNVTCSRLFALAEDGISETSVLHHYPYGNVYDDGKICWGGNDVNMPKIQCFKDFEKVVELFFGAETNNDLYQSPELKKDGKKVEMSQSELVMLLEGKEKFPVEFLRKSNEGTVQKL